MAYVLFEHGEFDEIRWFQLFTRMDGVVRAFAAVLRERRRSGVGVSVLDEGRVALIEAEGADQATVVRFIPAGELEEWEVLRRKVRRRLQQREELRSWRKVFA